MKKKNTYADQAKVILAKYKKRLGDDFTGDDKLAKEAMSRELTELKNKQESFKAQEQQTQFETMMKKGGKLPTYEGTESYSSQIKRPTDFEGNEVDIGYTPLDLSQFDISPEQEAALMVGKEAENLKFGSNANNFKIPTNTKVDAQTKDEYYNPALGGTSVLPLAASVAGNILYANSAKNPNQVKYDRVRPQKISLAEERASIRRDAESARLMSLRNARGLGLNAAATATMGIGSMADINKVSGSQIGKSYLNEKTTNTANKFRADTTNAQIDMREKETNLREKDIAEATKQQAIQNIIQSTGQYFSDVQKAKTFNSQMNAMPGTAKQFVDPDQSLGNRLVMGQKSIIKQDPAEMAKYNNSNNEPYWLKDYYNKKSYYNNITE